MDTYHHGNLRNELLTHARAFLDEGAGGTLPSLRELARRAGVSPTAVYHHFPAKEDLLAAVAASLLEELQAEWDGLGLEELGPSYLRFFRRHPAALGLVYGPQVRAFPRVAELQDQAYGRLVARLPQGPMGQPDHAAGLLVWGLVQGLAQLYASGALGAAPDQCPGGPELWYQEPDQVMAALTPYIRRALGS